MSWRDAPLYIETYDLAVWLIQRTAAWSDMAPGLLAERVAGSGADLAVQASLALTFPGSRAEHLEALDRGIVRLRIELRLAQSLGGISPRQLRFASERLSAIGRMVGGWRKRVAHNDRRREKPLEAARSQPPKASDQASGVTISGEGPPPAGA